MGSVTSPLVGMAGEFSALPLGVIIFTSSLLSALLYVVLIKNGKAIASTKEISNL
ncbi:hypothetical protein M3175_13220 [Robertmurraya korlensis]|uniref:hypothetical protein n=1 Tax=Robertmurraya korlensis TaxID=519977 RepID=UPI00203FC4F3|nr:hypothetical protein [Robertmurraya korlensis]MCM3601699.1 hypothetical protein [Robertmurraya korlensis]